MSKTVRRVPYICTFTEQERAAILKEEGAKPKLRLCLVGPCGAGKTSLLSRWLGCGFSCSFGPTCGANYSVFERPTCTELVWDTAGQERFSSLLPVYLRGASLVVLVFPFPWVGSVFSVWLDSVRNIIPTHCEVVVCFNKADLATNEEREEAQRETTKANLRYFETSCLSGLGCEELHDACGEILEETTKRTTAGKRTTHRTGNAEDTATQTDKGGCC